MYKLYARLGDGEFVYVASRNGLQEALQLADALNASWPRQYEVRDSQGNGVNFLGERSAEHECQSASLIS